MKLEHGADVSVELQLGVDVIAPRRRQLRTGLPRRLLEFFQRNPDEYLTMEDARVKFGVTMHRLYMAVDRLQKDGHLERTKVMIRLPSAKRPA